MGTQWAYNWVLWLTHYKKNIFWGLTAVSMLNLIGLVKADFAQPEFYLVWMSLLAMSLVAMKLLDSVKSGLLLMGLSLYVVLMVLAGFAWFDVQFDALSILGWVVVMTIMMSHLIHYLVAVLREMARGSFQHDALAAALGQVNQPILLSSLTTVLGFWVAAGFDAQYTSMAWIVSVGTLMSYAVLLTWSPLVLLFWFLEFRVGHYDDRHGVAGLNHLMERFPRAPQFILGVFLILVILSFWPLLSHFEELKAFLLMMLASFGLLWLVWHKFHIALISVLIAVFSVVLVSMPLFALSENNTIALLVLVVPMGIVLDDVIHFYSRYLKSSQYFFSKHEDKTRFALNSVGRAIWLTSQILIVGLLVLLFSDNLLIQQASGVTILSLLLVSFILLGVIPLLKGRML